MTDNITLGQIIRKLRKEKGLTQEELAEQLMVSSQAVSKWENGSSMPDISQVVPIAKFFGVTTDYLFGISDKNNDDEVRLHLEEIHRIFANCPVGEEGPNALIILEKYRGAIRMFPGNPYVLTEAMAFLSTIITYNRKDLVPLIGEDGFEKLVDEMEEYAGLVIKYSSEIDCILSAKRRLIEINMRKKKVDKALEIAKTFPLYFTDSRFYQEAGIYYEAGRKEEEKNTRCAMVAILISDLSEQAACLGNIYMDQGDYNQALYCYNFMRDIVEALYRNEKYHPQFSKHYYPLYRFPAFCLMKLGKHDEAIKVLNEGVDFIIAQGEGYNVKKEFDIPLLQGCWFSYGFDGSAKYNVTAALKNLISSSAFKELEDHPDYKALVERVNSAAK